MTELQLKTTTKLSNYYITNIKIRQGSILSYFFIKNKFIKSILILIAKLYEICKTNFNKELIIWDEKK